MIIKEKTDTGYTFENEHGDLIHLTYGELRDIDVLLSLEQMKREISFFIDEYDGDVISIGSLDMSREEFEQEIFDLLHDRMMDGYYGGDAPSEEVIKDTVLDTADDYGIRID